MRNEEQKLNKFLYYIVTEKQTRNKQKKTDKSRILFLCICLEIKEKFKLDCENKPKKMQMIRR